MELCKPDTCTGCGACANACPQDCIHMEPDAEGFLHPVVEAETCIQCGRCIKSCPVAASAESRRAGKKETKAYGACFRDEEIRLASTSGGVFTALCIWVLQRGGVVFGAAYDDLFQVQHIFAESEEDLAQLRGAKYAQSDIGYSFRRVRRALEDGRYVLFSGTPCQTAGLLTYLGKEYEKLILVDVICHGVPSPAVWQEYLRYRSRTDAQGSGLAAVYLRSKETGWPNYSVHITYANGTEYRAPHTADPYMRAFVGNLCLRTACYECQFKGIDRTSDFTLGDYWGVWDQLPAFNDGKGTSLVLLHSEKAARIWEELHQGLRYEQVDAAVALAENPSALHAPQKSLSRKTFMENYSVQDFEQLTKSLCPTPVPRKGVSWKRYLKKGLKRLLRGGKSGSSR